jgi:hypothetical protein
MPERKRFDPKQRGAFNDDVLNAFLAHEISIVNLILAFDALDGRSLRGLTRPLD